MLRFDPEITGPPLCPLGCLHIHACPRRNGAARDADDMNMEQAEEDFDRFLRRFHGLGILLLVVGVVPVINLVMLGARLHDGGLNPNVPTYSWASILLPSFLVEMFVVPFVVAAWQPRSCCACRRHGRGEGGFGSGCDAFLFSFMQCSLVMWAGIVIVRIILLSDEAAYAELVLLPANMSTMMEMNTTTMPTMLGIFPRVNVTREHPALTPATVALPVLIAWLCVVVAACADMADHLELWRCCFSSADVVDAFNEFLNSRAEHDDDDIETGAGEREESLSDETKGVECKAVELTSSWSPDIGTHRNGDLRQESSTGQKKIELKTPSEQFEFMVRNLEQTPGNDSNWTCKQLELVGKMIREHPELYSRNRHKRITTACQTKTNRWYTAELHKSAISCLHSWSRIQTARGRIRRTPDRKKKGRKIKKRGETKESGETKGSNDPLTTEAMQPMADEKKESSLQTNILKTEQLATPQPNPLLASSNQQNEDAGVDTKAAAAAAETRPPAPPNHSEQVECALGAFEQGMGDTEIRNLLKREFALSTSKAHKALRKAKGIQKERAAAAVAALASSSNRLRQKLRLKSVSNSLTCDICGEKMSRGSNDDGGHKHKAATTATCFCNHYFHFECLGNYVKRKIRADEVNEEEMDCPNPTCTHSMLQDPMGSFTPNYLFTRSGGKAHGILGEAFDFREACELNDLFLQHRNRESNLFVTCPNPLCEIKIYVQENQKFFRCSEEHHGCGKVCVFLFLFLFFFFVLFFFFFPLAFLTLPF